MFVTKNCIERIKYRIDLLDVVKTYIDLEQIGSHWRGLSPFTSEETPSFFIDPEKNIFRCYSSGHAGDVIRFMQLKNNLTFQESVEQLSYQFKINLNFDQKNKLSILRTNRQEIIEIHNEALKYFHFCLKSNSYYSKLVRNYWCNERLFGVEVSNEHQIGLSFPMKNNKLASVLMERKFSIESIIGCGLFFKSKYGNAIQKLLPKFQGRIMIPIRDIYGRCIAFTARKIPIVFDTKFVSNAKYINSPKTCIFDKKNLLFGLDKARHHLGSKDSAIIVEGQLDAIRCWQNGLLNTLSAQGTAISINQLVIIRRYTSKLLVLLDNDNAGNKTALRLLSIAFQIGFEVSFIRLPENVDPDGLFKSKKINAKNFLKRSQDSIEFIINLTAPKGKKASIGEKIKVFDLICDFFQNSKSLIMAQHFLQKAGMILGLYEYIVDQKLTQIKLKKFKSSAVLNKIESFNSAEYQLLSIILNNDYNIAYQLTQIIDFKWINHTVYGNLLNRVLMETSTRARHNTIHANHIFENEADKNIFYQIAFDGKIIKNPTLVANQCIKSIFKKYYHKKRNEINQKIVNNKTKNIQLVKLLQKQRIVIRRKLKNSPEIMQK